MDVPAAVDDPLVWSPNDSSDSSFNDSVVMSGDSAASQTTLQTPPSEADEGAEARRTPETVVGAVTRPKVLLLGEIESPEARKAYQELSFLADLITPRSTTRTAFLEEARSGAFDGVTVIYRTFASIEMTGRVDDEVVEALPTSVKFICHNGAGYDQINVAACSRRRIRVAHTPGAVDDCTADTAAFLILGCLRNLAPAIRSARAGHWRGPPHTPLPALGHDPRGRTLGILGLGGIGRGLARKMRAFGMRVCYHNRRRLSASVERDAGAARYVGFRELLEQSDVVSLHVPLTAQTRHLIGAPELARMRPGAVLVNTARGAVVDEAALAAALAAGRLAGAGLDVFEHEPRIHEELLRSERCLLLPHMGTWTVETQREMELCVVGNVRSALEGGRLRTGVREQREEVAAWEAEEEGEQGGDGAVEEKDGRGAVGEARSVVEVDVPRAEDVAAVIADPSPLPVVEEKTP